MVCATLRLLENGFRKVEDLNLNSQSRPASILLDQFSPAGTSYSLFTPSINTSAASTVVFIHGVGLNKWVWDENIAYFQQKHVVLSYDILGHGQSPLPRADVELEDYAEQLAELMQHLQIKSAHIIGHSMGALISVAFALKYPHKVLSLMPLNIVYQRTKLQQKAVRARADEVSKKQKNTGVNAALQRWFKPSTDPDYRKRVARVKSWLNSVDARGYSRCYALFAHSDEAFVGSLHTINTPCLFMTGEQDSNSTPQMSQKMANQVMQGRCLIIENEAHMMAYISPAKVNRHLEEFFTQVEKLPKSGGVS